MLLVGKMNLEGKMGRRVRAELRIVRFKLNEEE